MTQTPHPLDVSTDNLGRIRRLLLRAFLADSTIDSTERAALEAFDAERGAILQYRQREAFADSFKRNGASIRTRRLMAEAGYDLIDLDAERGKRRSNVVQFPTDRNAG